MRGGSLLDFLISYDLNILNLVNMPTFITRTMQEVLDITIGTHTINEYVKHWHISDESLLSDHGK